MNKPILTSFILIGIAILAGIVLYPHAPNVFATHWDLAGQVNGHSSKLVGLFLMPAIALVITALFSVLPSIDPLGKNIVSFRKYFNTFTIIFVVFLLYVHTLTVLWNFGFTIDIGRWILPAIGTLLWYTGDMLARTKRNFTIGIRTPWTLSSDTVWDKTHVLGGKLFKASGILTALGVLLPLYGFVILMGTILGSTVITVVYSYLAYKKESKVAGN